MTTELVSAGRAWLAQLAQSIQRHPKRVTAAIAAFMLTAGGGAFAVASFGPDPANLPVRTLTQPIASLADGSTLADLTDLNDFSLYRTEYTRASDTPESLLKRLGVEDPGASAFLRSNELVRQHILNRSGRLVSAETSNDHQLRKLTVRWIQDENSDHFQRLVLERQDDGEFAATVSTAPLTVNTRLTGATIHTSLFAATDDAGLPDAVAIQLTDIFSDIDFRRLHKGDRFSVIYETLEADGEFLRTGRVLAAEFKNRDKLYQAMWFEEPGERGSYYAMDGSSLRRAYLNSPVEFSRISSNFAMRKHPIHGTWRRHLGTDYAAPTGTKVRTVGDGVVDFAGWQNGFGNVIFIKHANTSHVTVYAHLSRIDVKKGQRVEQGQNIGAVGSTGWSTGPHLHFEFRVNGVHQDPQSVIAAKEANPISEKVREAFMKQASALHEQLASAELIRQASAQ
ncbi:M23 family metallopeptidase [Comamonas kerstersii]|uniref:Peptidase M23 n=1 Tax=Comamonas kerstersii TaxID=225992 RepID=A0A0W7YZJ3_9BURK|nr:M23 family metallopeptidase [Comamonas kerstersii]KUF40583.1 peptidase M23 [Comamonas kerstersii]OOH86957.1 peptidase M23 [Comamonas kerstersii]OOH90029.1 peptidase M23 [Comamonas kerstersii]